MTAPEQESIFRRWLEQHLGLILKVVRGCAAAQDQDDLLQEILLNVWRSVPAFRGEAKETTWIYRVAFNTSLAWRRVERRRREKHDQFLKVDLLSSDPPGHSDAGHEEMIQQLYVAIRQLPRLDASLALMHLDGLSYRDMADVLGISENYIGVKLSRIRKQLAALMKGAIDDL